MVYNIKDSLGVCICVTVAFSVFNKPEMLIYCAVLMISLNMVFEFLRIVVRHIIVFYPVAIFNRAG